jgi:hypothetical protein
MQGVKDHTQVIVGNSCNSSDKGQHTSSLLIGGCPPNFMEVTTSDLSSHAYRMVGQNHLFLFYSRWLL